MLTFDPSFFIGVFPRLISALPFTVEVIITSILLCLFFGAGLLLALYIIRRQIVAPLTRLSLAMERAADLGDLSTRMVVERNDELGQLSENFNHLMKSLEERSSTQHKSDPR